MQTSPTTTDHQVHYRNVHIDGVDLFYREAGSPQAPTVLLLHGFGASSFMFRALIPVLARQYHVLAPDLPGFGQSTVSDPAFKYTFDNLAVVIDAFTLHKDIERYALYVFDYGAPVGWRLAVNNPHKITAILTQNGNGYEEGLSAGWADMRRAWADPTPANREALRRFNTPEMIRWQYTEGAPDASLLAPEAWLLTSSDLARTGVEPQMDLLLDYGSNIAQYDQLHAYLRRHQPPLLALWGRNDPFFVPAGAEAFRRDNPNAEVRFLETGHFAIETHGADIAAGMLALLERAAVR